MKTNYKLLSRYICRNDNKEVLALLENDTSLDVMHDEGTFFNMSIESGYTEIVQTLLDYFNKSQLAKYQNGSTEYLLLKTKIRDILEIAIEDVNLSEEMKKVLSSYIDFEGSEHGTIDDFLDDYQGKDDVCLNLQFSTSPMKKSYSMDDIKNYSKKSDSTYEHSDEELAHKSANFYEDNTDIIGHLEDFTNY